MTHHHFYNLADETRDAVESLLDAAAHFRTKPLSDILRGKQFGLLFLAPSLRTRCSFEVGIRQLGGGVTSLEPSMFYGLEMRDGVCMDGERAEHIREAVAVLSRFYSGLGIRVMAGGEDRSSDLEDDRFRQFERHATVPVFSMESAKYHPCQALADLLTIRQALGEIAGRRLTITWAPHPRPLPMAVPNSILLAAAQMGMNVTLTHPAGFDLDEGILGRARELAGSSGGALTVSGDQEASVSDAEVVYAKSWGALSRYESPEAEQALRARASEWIVDEKLMRNAPDAYFMHCLPVRRNVVVSDAVIDSSRSIVIEQAENRLHAQKAMLARLYG